MFVSLLVTTAVGFIAAIFGLRAQEEIVKIGAIGVAIVCAFLGLVFAPFLLKLALVAIPLLVKERRWI